MAKVSDFFISFFSALCEEVDECVMTNCITPLKQGGLAGGVGQGWRGSNHVDLFLPDVGVGNKEYEKEKSAKELQQKRFEGSAPARLGGDDGGKTVPWYVERGCDKQDRLFVKGRAVSGKLAEEAKQRDEARKDRDDPLSFLLKPSIKAVGHQSTPSNLECVEDVSTREIGDHDNVKQDRKLSHAVSSHRKSKKKVKEKKKKKHKKHKGNHHSVNSKVEGPHTENTSLKILRLRRLERERGARLQASLLTGEDLAALRDDQAYNSQFNPALARQNCCP